MSYREAERNSSAQQTLDSESERVESDFLFFQWNLVLYEISQLLNTQLDKATLATCIGMIENGVNPEALAVCPRSLVHLYVD